MSRIDYERPLPMSDVAGLNPEAERLAVSFAVQACPAFVPSRHGNAYRRMTGAMAICCQCGKPQHQHWLRQALSAIAKAEGLRPLRAPEDPR
jgi:hypothetical protein